jgi:hypothetical protein
MSDILEVTVSGTVGKQAVATTKKVVLKSVIIAGITSGALVTIRDGNASGNTILNAGAIKYDSVSHDLGKFRADKGLHVKVLGGGCKCYLVID